MEYKKRKHNTPIATVIKNYLDKDGGKVTVSRNEIDWRFNALDWRYQKQILFAFLQSGLSDRKWAYKKLYAFWDDCFIPVLQDLWEQYHELQLSWLVINFFPIEYLKKNMDVLNAGRNYFFICKRLISDSEFRVDKERLYESDYLSLLVLQKYDVSPVVVWRLFYTQIRKICLGEYKVRINDLKFYSERGTDVISIFNCSIIKSMLETIYSDLHMFELHKQLNKWIDEVSEDVMRSREWFLLNNCDLIYTIQNKMALILMRKYCYEHLDSAFKVEGITVDTRELDELLEKLEVIASLGETKRELEEKDMATSFLIDFVNKYRLVRTGECPF